MGVDKALLRVDGQAMAARVADALQQAGLSPVRAVGGDEERLRALGLEWVADDRPGAGPLSATITALRHAGTPTLAVLSCDLLAPSPMAVRALADALASAPGAAVAVPVVAGRHQWVHAMWRSDALPDLEQAWGEGVRSLRSAARRVEVVEVADIDPEAVADADEPGDLAGRATPPG